MKKTIKITGIALIAILIIFFLLLLTPSLFKDKFATIVKNTANKAIRTELNFSGMEVSFFRHFPNLTITLSDVSLKSSAPFSTDTLIKAKDISFGVNLKSLFRGPVTITKIFVNKGSVVIQYNEKGNSNYEVFTGSSDSTQTKDTTSSSSAGFQIEHIAFIKTDFIYSDPSVPLKIAAWGINYHGKSLLEDEILKLSSRVQIDSVDCFYNHIPVIDSKPVRAQLSTNININSLQMKFEKNDLYIKDIPCEFRGEFSFREKGYDFFLSLFSMYGDEYISGSLHLVSDKNLWVYAKADVNIDLNSWTKGLGIRDTELRGMFSMKLKAEGKYATGQNPVSNNPDTILLSVPNVTITSNLANGYFRYKKLPEPITGISYNLKANLTNNDYRSVTVHLENVKAGFMKNKMEGYFRLDGLKDFPFEGKIHTQLNLAELHRVVPLDSLDLKGMLELNLITKGKYAPEKKMFPVTRVNLNLTQGAVLTKYYPHPVENINVSATVTNNNGILSDSRVKLDMISFSFEGNPFEVYGEISNPDDVHYDLTSQGSIDIASIYKVFSQQGMDLKGYLSANLKLKGQQSDAMAGRLDRLHNSGTLVLRDIAFSTEYLPKPVIVKSGVFRFDNDKIWFEKFRGAYGASDITLNGHLRNVVNYFLSKNQTLKGSLTFRSKYLLLDEFRSPENGAPVSAADSGSGAGVIMIPKDMEIGLNADLKKISFNKLDITNLLARVEIKKGLVLMKDMKCRIIGCNVDLNATYGSLDVNKAFFDFHITARDFDVKRAFNEVELFSNLSASAGKCEGIISLDYTLKGRLTDGMNPVYSSLEGNGVLSLEKVKVMGLKLFTAMGKNLDKEKIKNPDLSKVELKTRIKNNVITLERTKIKIAGFRLRMEGETNFSGKLNLKTRLGLPPFGILGIPIRILGTQENPKFKYGRGNQDESVEETIFSDEIPADILLQIQNVKEEDLKEDPQ